MELLEAEIRDLPCAVEAECDPVYARASTQIS